MLTPETVLESIGEGSEALDDLSQHWLESMQAMPENAPPFLIPEHILENRTYCGLDSSLDEQLLKTANKILANPALKCMAWHAYWRIFMSESPCPPRNWPEPGILGENAGLFFLLIALGFVPVMREHHKRMGIPADVTLETARQVQCYCDHTYRRGNEGRPGIYLGPLSWLRHYTREKYFRLGRLEYWLGPHPYPVNVYRHRTKGEIITLYRGTTRFSKDGFLYRSPEDYPTGEGWQTAFEEDSTMVKGWVISPLGHGIDREVSLSKNEWECVLGPGDLTLQIHIPSGGRMDLDACRQSFTRASHFFAEHFPDQPAKAFVCSSWIFNTQLLEIFGVESNLCQFQNELYLFPVPSGPWDGLWFIFLQHGELDFSTAPRETKLQKKILHFLAQGNRWRCGGMLFLMDDVPRFGTSPYSGKWPPGILT